MNNRKDKIIVYGPYGLSNRLRLLFSAKYIADTTNKKMEFIWEANTSCGAKFSDLFENKEFKFVKYSIWKKIFYKEINFENDKNTGKLGIDIFKTKFKRTIIRSPLSLLAPREFDYHKIHQKKSDSLFNTLIPIPYIRDEVINFTEKNFTSKTIGVHIRRGDFTFELPKYTKNLPLFYNEIDLFLEKNPDGKVFVSTDDGSYTPGGCKTNKENVIDLLIDRYGENKILFYNTRSFYRGKVKSIQDALINILILRKTDEFVGNEYSSFSGMVMIDRDVPQKRV